MGQCNCKNSLVSFLLLNFLVAPLFAVLIALVFGSVLAYAEEWPVFGIDGGFYYVLTNVASVPPVGSQTITEGKMGIVVDILISTVCLVFASTVVGCSGMLAFVGDLPRKLGLTTVARGFIALLLFIPAATLAGCAFFGALLAWLEEIQFTTCFQFIVSSVCGLGNPLTTWVPKRVDGIIAVATLGVAAQGLIGVIIGIASGITPLVDAVTRFDRRIHQDSGAIDTHSQPVVSTEGQQVSSTDDATDLEKMTADEVLAYARRLQASLSAAENTVVPHVSDDSTAPITRGGTPPKRDTFFGGAVMTGGCAKAAHP